MDTSNISSREQFFPIENISQVERLFEHELKIAKEPDLTLLSIVVGNIENLLTCSRLTNINTTAGDQTENGASDAKSADHSKLPVIDFKIVDSLYKKFHSTIRGYIDMSQFADLKYATRELVKQVSDIIWNSLTRSYYKDRAHLQSLYSYLTGNKLDCFGVAFAVVAACQLLGFDDVHLALSEDHAWVIFGENCKETAEVTWHGKGNEDKRGQSVDAGTASKCWLYLNGYPVRCNRNMEVAALVSAINPSLNVNSDAIEVALLQQKLLWLLYDMGHLSTYPMAIGNLGDLEEKNPTPSRPHCSKLFQEAIVISRSHYKNMHVYPYTYEGGYFYRQNMYKEAFASWANASDVLKQYNYTRDDEEIYKEVMEIANELIPHIMKVVSGHDAHSILKDPECFAHLLRFYDGICQWEEGSQTPVLHIGWAKPLVNTISKFEFQVRGQIEIVERDSQDDENCNYSVSLHPSDGESRSQVKDFLNFTYSDRNMLSPERELRPDITKLTAACGEKLLNRDFLIQGGGEPFIGDDVDDDMDVKIKTTTKKPFVELETNGESIAQQDNKVVRSTSSQSKIALCSKKMKGLKNLLLGEKLNTHAISLQLTAQSQVQVSKKSSFRDSVDSSSGVIAGSLTNRSKRSRRE